MAASPQSSIPLLPHPGHRFLKSRNSAIFFLLKSRMYPSERNGGQSSSTLRQAFDEIDTDRDGMISKEDLRRFYAGVTSAVADEDAISTMMMVADSNKDGYVGYDEFEGVLLGKKRWLGVMEEVFKAMDKDGDGKLSHEDLKSFMRGAGISVRNEDVRAMIRLSGGDEKEGVSFHDFLKILTVDRVY